ncbi:hypothetical protein M595_5152 [Lyngbya aestuarii BL J]|uniref:Uncharacterized protein n=1 Tax=Lyngbya aestuarii BL J TaxID=1348334 RepID=U7QEP8_9CYAN|nr:hypothetical protein [Lyngbya aestuarii]ERT04906.1 hypothetical protein M595_5152 [Lyngbya aestuarii BL J]
MISVVGDRLDHTMNWRCPRTRLPEIVPKIERSPLPLRLRRSPKKNQQTLSMIEG